ncbi:TetR/AcrR family transcriptional regulator [Lactiplantibacillus sp. WILCCON 0030]|uniref:TetR/AcrR family transcriptional regulator n=2 Tax=Lactiplantibacillus brownii TaxID=3069269 RepID=A0ABU1AAT1_9LACO|nr:TetR/AcrR family transcriptional regulator [Lactiplantibacillus brownii]MDQ7937966.1 TetR/AcrR family transcriptional regulator [Lactiplantibacillus brownii]
MTNRAAAAAETRKKLIENADRLLFEKGYQQMSIVDITKASGVAKGTFYNYFETKEALLLELSKLHLSKLTRQLPQLATVAPQQALHDYMVDYMRVVVESGDNMARQWIRFVVDPKNQQKWQFDLASLEELIQGLVDNHRLAASTPVQRLAELLITDIYGIVFSWCISPTTIDPIQSVVSFCELQLAAILQTYEL